MKSLENSNKDTIYGKTYAQTWIKNYESGKDSFRVKYLEPYLKKTFSNINKNQTLLDIGCGWGSLLEFLPSNTCYQGIDIAPNFFDYIKNKFSNKNINLKYGKLPNQIDVKSNHFDICVCSQVLHTVLNSEESIKTLFSKLKLNGNLFVITFNNQSKNSLISSFNQIEKLDDSYIMGELTLPSKLKIQTEIHFHKEKDYENEFLKYGYFRKTQLGPIFTAYKCTKIRQ